MKRWMLWGSGTLLAVVVSLVNPVTLPQKNTTLVPVKATSGEALPDHDKDGIDDFTDIMQGAYVEANAHPDYVSAYYSIYSPGMENYESIYFDFEYPGGYPPDTEGGVYGHHLARSDGGRLQPQRVDGCRHQGQSQSLSGHYRA